MSALVTRIGQALDEYLERWLRIQEVQRQKGGLTRPPVPGSRKPAPDGTGTARGRREPG